MKKHVSMYQNSLCCSMPYFAWWSPNAFGDSGILWCGIKEKYRSWRLQPTLCHGVVLHCGGSLLWGPIALSFDVLPMSHSVFFVSAIREYRRLLRYLHTNLARLRTSHFWFLCPSIHHPDLAWSVDPGHITDASPSLARSRTKAYQLAHANTQARARQRATSSPWSRLLAAAERQQCRSRLNGFAGQRHLAKRILVLHLCAYPWGCR